MAQIHLASLFWLLFLPHGGHAVWQVSLELIDTTEVPCTAMAELKREVEGFTRALACEFGGFRKARKLTMRDTHAGSTF